MLPPVPANCSSGRSRPPTTSLVDASVIHIREDRLAAGRRGPGVEAVVQLPRRGRCGPAGARRCDAPAEGAAVLPAPVGRARRSRPPGAMSPIALLSSRRRSAWARRGSSTFGRTSARGCRDPSGRGLSPPRSAPAVGAEGTTRWRWVLLGSPSRSRLYFPRGVVRTVAAPVVVPALGRLRRPLEVGEPGLQVGRHPCASSRGLQRWRCRPPVDLAIGARPEAGRSPRDDFPPEKGTPSPPGRRGRGGLWEITNAAERYRRR